jgi:two-component system chemotaxis response regulator CheB
VVTLDIDMPEMDGLEMLRRLRAEHPAVRVIMVSSLTERGARITVESLFLGASDYVTKASHTSSREQALSYLRAQLVPKIRALVPRRGPAAAAAVPSQPSPAPSTAARAPASPVEVVAIGASTGGPNALAAVMPAFPTGFGIPVLIVQHMPENFTAYLAMRLNKSSRIAVEECADGRSLEAGVALIAPGNFHMEIESRDEGLVARTGSGPQVNSCRPSVDVLFRSVVDTFGSGVLAVVLTGMGQDGLRGCEAIREAGGQVMVQDAATSVVWGMPGQVAQAHLADAILPIQDIGREIVRRVEASRR